MPAQNLSRPNSNGFYSHIYNRGVENKIIFNDQEDYRIFLSYLNDYLSPPANPESTRKDFSINGRTFRGTPHQPKNYFNQVILISYCIMPDHFHLIVYQATKGSLEKFIRSLSTRYSMYFNKKYQRSGPLLQGPYKSVQIDNEARLLYLTRYLHTKGYSSYSEYIGIKDTPWVKPSVVLSIFNKAKTDSIKGADSYKAFVENDQFGQKEKELLDGFTLEVENQHLEKSVLASKIDSRPKIQPNPKLKAVRRTPELVTAGTIFLLLVGLGLRNINISKAKLVTKSSPTPVVLHKAVEVKTTEEVKPKTMLTIKVSGGDEPINIYEAPTHNSKKIGEAKDGDTFEYVSSDSVWYEIVLADGSVGFTSSKYIEPVQMK